MNEPQTRSGRHASTSVSRFDAQTLAIVALVAVVLTLGGFGLRALLSGGDGDTSTASADETANAQECESPIEVRVAAAPEVAAAVEQAASVAAVDECTTYAVEAREAAQVASDIEAGEAPDVWVPDAADWPSRITEYRTGEGQFTLANLAPAQDDISPELTAAGWTSLGSVARTPVVLAVGADSTLTSSTTWRDLFTTAPALRMAHPSTDSDSRLAFLVGRGATPAEGDDYLLLGQRVIFVSRFAAPSTTTLLEQAAPASEDFSPFPVSEQRLAAFTGEDGSTGLVPLLLAGGSPELTYPLYARADLPLPLHSAAKLLFDATQGAEVVAALGEAGFRVTGSAGPTIDGVAPAAYEAAPLPDAERAIEATHLWETLRLDMRMVAAIDVSGSMRWAAGDTTRLDLLQRATNNALAILPDGSQIGAWVFSTQIGPAGEDWLPIVPVRALSDDVEGVAQRQVLKNEVDNLDDRITGDTGLYDTALAAYLEVQAGYDARYINSVVLITDGINDDPPGGLDQEQLLAKLAEAADPERPVRIVTIGIGPDTDPRALQAISDATGGTSYVATAPSDIEMVFFRALLARAA